MNDMLEGSIPNNSVGHGSIELGEYGICIGRKETN
jgi:hypothetical protein